MTFRLLSVAGRSLESDGLFSLHMRKPAIQWRPLLTDEIFLVVPPEHRLAAQNSIPLREVAHERVVMEKVGSGLRDLIDHFCQQAGFTPRIVYEVDEPAVLFEFVKAHLGVAFAPAVVKKQISEHSLRALHLTNPSCQRTFGIAWHQEHYLSEAARAFRQFVMEYFANLEQEASSV